ncbi:MAG: signal peptidase II, partial [Chloroflexota bacterium]
MHGEVVDFIRLPRWPTFNVADIAVTFGSIALIVAVLRGSRAHDDETTGSTTPA